VQHHLYFKGYTLTIENLQKILRSTLDSFKIKRCLSFEEKFRHVMNDPDIQELLNWEIPKVTDISNELNISGGNVKAIRMDLLEGAVGLKKPV